MFFAKKKLLAVLTILGGFLGYDVSLADIKKPQISNQLQGLEQPEAKIVGREENKDKTINKYIKDLEFHRSLNGSAVFEVAFEENISNFSGYKISYHKMVIH